MTKEDIDRAYYEAHDALEAEYFDLVDEGLPTQQRQLKEGMNIQDFNERHGANSIIYEIALTEAGFLPSAEI